MPRIFLQVTVARNAISYGDLAKRPALVRTTILTFLTVAVLFGCAKKSADKPTAINGGKYYAVTTDKTSFYKYGPQQGNGPDQQLNHDTLLTLIRPSFGYCKVRLLDGQQGYVASEDIRTASAQLVAAATAPTPGPVATNSIPTHINPNDPRFQPPPAPLPESFPEPTAIPEAAGLPSPN